MVAGFDAEFVVAASQVLDERVIPDHVGCGLIGSQTAHRPEPCLESSVVALDAVVIGYDIFGASVRCRVRF